MADFGAPCFWGEGGSRKFTGRYSHSISPGIRERVASGGTRCVATRRGRIVLESSESAGETRSRPVCIIDGTRQLQIPAARGRHPHLFPPSALRVGPAG